MRTERSATTGTGSTTRIQGASPPAYWGRARIAWRAAVCLLAWLASTGVGFAETIIWQENFDDGLGDNRWAADGTGTWHIGSPTEGSPINALGSRAFSGINCAGVGLSAPYIANQDSRLYSLVTANIPPIPAASQNPRLRFWQWYSIGGADHATVEIMPAGSTTWTTISPDYGDVGNINDVRTGGGVWSRPSLDLSAYAGKSVKIAFHFTSDGGSAAAPNAGWFVDDVALVTGTPVFNNPEGFESGLGDWAVEKGTWEVGRPTAGPPLNMVGSRAYDGTNCAGFVMAGSSYQANVDSRLISPPIITVPAANQNPRLRFWHWYSIGGGDHATVEILPAGSTTWTTISPDYGDVGNINDVRTGGGVWSRPSLDLSAYAGRAVQIAFHFISDGGSAAAPNAGWFVDDVALVTGTPVVYIPEGFEGGLGDWAVDKGTWQVGVPTSGPGAAYTGTNCAATVLAGNYPDNMDTRIISPALTLPGADLLPALRFRGWFRFASGDQGVVEIKASSSSNWTGLYTNSGISAGWSYPYIPLSSYGGETVQIAFHATSDSGSVDAGWYIDDITIVGYTNPPTITQPPANQTVSVDDPVTFVVVASGVGQLTYQWQFNDAAISGATGSSYLIASAQPINGGNYSVIVSNSAGATFSPEALLTVRSLPGTLTNDVVDPVTTPGSVSYTNHVFTVTGSGEDIQGTGDAFEFVHETLVGDGQIVARVTSLVGGDTGGAAEAGVMIRESLDAGSPHAFLRVNANTNVVFRRRLTIDDQSRDTASSSTNHNWLRLMRMGNTFVAHCSTNGTNWEYVWFTTVNMSNQVQVGLAVTAHWQDHWATATIDNVSIGSLSPIPGTWPLPQPKIYLGGEWGGMTEFQRVGGFKFLVGGVVGDQYSVKCSTNAAGSLASWQSLGPVTNTYGVVPFVDPEALTNQIRFYRVQRTGP